MSDLLSEHSYAPYSGKPRSCLVESKSGKFFTGIRIENISYPITIPAVQAACTICLSEGELPSKLFVNEHKYEQLDFWKHEFGLEVIVDRNIPFEKAENLYKNDPNLTDSTQKLKNLLQKAVVPHSDFPVSALLFTNTGYFEGVNVEVSEWTKGLCAERVVLAKAISAGDTEFDRLEIHTRKGEFSSPCGSCRQVIAEFLPMKKIILHHSDGTVSEHYANDLLPFSFKSDSLKK